MSEKKTRIAVSSTGPTLEDTVESRFGRCAYFLIIDPESMDFEAIENPNIALGGGAGIQSAQLMASKGVSVVLTGNCGPNAFQTFGAAGIQVITGVTGKVREVAERFRAGELHASSGAGMESRSGMGRGMGRGTGMGMGMGMGRGRGMGGGRIAATPMDRPATRQEEIALLRQEAEAMQNRLQEMESKLRELEGS